MIDIFSPCSYLIAHIGKQQGLVRNRMELEVGNIVFKKVMSKYNEECYEWLSSPLPIPFLNNAKVEIELEFNDQELKEFKHEIATTLNNALALGEDDREALKEHLFAYYRDFVLDVGEDYLEDMPPQDHEDRMLEFIRLSSLSICRSSMTKEFFCEFKGGCDWETEHGLSITFKNGVNIAKVGGYGHVTNSDAYADLSKDEYVYYGNFINTHAKQQNK
ncbi:DUF6985 domain-containing protein [Pseudoalteromonas atlantica]|uniref:DUF6985 domain-containing protein n=1 Tax=Pseudoalteromonas atlantica TaxID=288 RepID=UPI000BBBAD90|nr:hypothetical protein [Pseudoalteromonas atlantica]